MIQDAAPAPTLDVRHLPSTRFGHRSLVWWGTWGLMLIEGTAFALALTMYFYLRGLAAEWPIAAAPPELRWGSLNTGVLLAGLWPNWLTQRAAERKERDRTRLWLMVCLLVALATLALRALEFTALHVPWDANAYGSIVWLLLGLHTTHLIVATADSAVLAALLHGRAFEERHFVDLSENARYGYFVVASWLPLYGAIYAAPRL